ncbi:NADPH dehydrogenase NamA [Evansella cellulosilytica]|uniref:NADH:flavin oxidoreductase/NADH oxidase n=1 Tax=Evansella cellulosilytica (strain ATCC 21833 / DSM 2522 / FERM P-1141 / JCM 9156 / N-4) TaxID=649639 RepID=E6TXU4_EVAC2|nr:NADPH dehydrogenase NamA [Evansella cellulosilytica]ADU30020.1 NADH:flavin oxidoreductase/NADH oxidase [Evansella cellulosilytica DSM 2522]
MTAKLFTPITIKNVTLKNKIVMSPMCMYSSEGDGYISDFHYTHYISRAIGQVGLVMIEATAVTKQGQISTKDLGIYDDEHVQGLKKLVKGIKAYGARTAIQLGHAGRKAIFDGEIIAPSSIAFDQESKTPKKMSMNEITETIDAFKKAAFRSKLAGFDIVEIHAAHGYLINQFLSPLSNKRNDEYGGTRKNRFRFLKEIIHSVKNVWDGPLFVRISADEYDPDGNQMEDFIYFASEMKKLDVDLIDCSTGGVIRTPINIYPGYQIRHSETIKEHAKMATGAVGLITTGIQAEEILQNERADLIFVGRELLRNPYWSKTAADELHVKLDPPQQYSRGW